MQKLEYRKGDRFAPYDREQIITATEFVHVCDGSKVHLEGLNFDRNGDMFFLNIYETKIMKVDMKTKELSVFFDFKDNRITNSAVKFHKDGRLFVACCDIKFSPDGGNGGIYCLNPDGTNVKKVVSGFNVNDLVFDKDGGMYFTNYTGTPQNPTGSVEYVSPDLKTIKTVVPNLASPNGLALSTDGKILWVTEMNAGRLHRINLEMPRLSTISYFSKGYLGMDSCSVDEDDNLYVAMARQGQILVFNPNGFLIGRVLTPDREYGKNLGTTHPMVRPGHKELYFTCHDVTEDGNGANIFCCGTYANGNGKAYQFL